MPFGHTKCGSASAPDAVHFSYRRYVVNQLRKHFGFEGVPIRVAYREKRRGRKKPGEGREAREAPDAPADGDDDVDFD